MSYCTTHDVERQLRNASNLRMGDVADLAEHIADAQDWVDAQLGALGYSVPLGSAPPYIATTTAVYAAYIALAAANTDGNYTDAVRDLERRARANMSDLVAGRAILPGVRVSLEDTADGTGVAVSNPHGRPVMRYGTDGRRL